MAPIAVLGRNLGGLHSFFGPSSICPISKIFSKAIDKQLKQVVPCVYASVYAFQCP